MATQPSESMLIQQVRLNYEQILLMLTTLGGQPTTSQVQAFFDRLGALNAGLPSYLQINGPGQQTHTVGDETYNWTEYQEFIVGALQTLREQQQQADGPFWLSTSYRPC